MSEDSNGVAGVGDAGDRGSVWQGLLSWASL